MDWIELSGHYGRDYANQQEVRADWEANKDFRVNEGGRYGAATNREDLEAMKARGEISGVTIRYGKGLKVVDMKL
jgi:hypothetical protein